MERTALITPSNDADTAGQATGMTNTADPSTSPADPSLGQPARTQGAGGARMSGSRAGGAAGPTLVDRIKDKLPLLDYARRYTQLKASPTGKGEHFGKCPSPDHEDGRPSFYVNENKQIYSCRGCGISGNVIQLHALMHNMTAEDAKFELGRQLGVFNERRLDDAESLLNKAVGRYTWQLERKLDAVDYLIKERGLTIETMERFGIGYCWGTEYKDLQGDILKLAVDVGLARESSDPARPPRAFMAGRITFPVKDRTGKVVGFAGRLLPNGFNSNGPKYINSPETKLFRKSELLYGAYEALPGISKAGYAVVVEGYMDVVATHQCGATNTVAVMGASANEATFESLWAMTKRLVFCLDGDAAGDAGAMRSVLAAAPTMEDGCEIGIATLPAGVDPDEFILEHGFEAWRQNCESATPLSRFLMEARSHNHDLSYPEGRARFMEDARQVAELFVKAPTTREQIVAEARAINAAALVDTALGLTGLAETVKPQELRDAIALMQRRLASMEPGARPVSRAARPR